MLRLLDIFLTFVHLVIIVFNLFGWIWPVTRKAHFICVLATAASWFVLGIWFGIGYCPITDWQWRVKEQLGEHDLPASFIKYYADKLSQGNISSSFIDTVTVISFAIAALLSVYVNFIKKET
ncbi:MAG TPA: DUF2784 domain-containing protein [Chitinophagaceae bacterium]|nr:DUF2784 domain-containing protein [Chitinophagaceae bacterium]